MHQYNDIISCYQNYGTYHLISDSIIALVMSSFATVIHLYNVQLVDNCRMSDPSWCRVTAEERARLRQAEVAHAMEAMLLEASALASVAATERDRRELLARNALGGDRFVVRYIVHSILILILLVLVRLHLGE